MQNTQFIMHNNPIIKTGIKFLINKTAKQTE